MLFISSKDEHFPYTSGQYVIEVSEECWSQHNKAGAYLPDSDSRGSSVNASALKSKGSASCRSSIRSLSVLLLALVYLDTAAKEGKSMFTFLLSLWVTVYELTERKVTIIKDLNFDCDNNVKKR